MRLSVFAVVLAGTCVQCFSNTSPFVLFSTAELKVPSNIAQLQSARQVFASTQEILSTCPTERYLLVSQPKLHATDVRDPMTGACTGLPNLCRAVESDAVRGRFSVAEVLGQIESQKIVEDVTRACADRGRNARVQEVEMRWLPSVKKASQEALGRDERAEILADNDHQFSQKVAALGSDYTVILISDPHFRSYEAEFDQALRMELKRGEDPVRLRSKKDSSSTSHLPLFEKYQFFTPGIFMVFIALGIISTITTVGIRALADLKVPYVAFQKDSGPAAQKKLQ